MTEKIVEGAKQISVKAASAACRAAVSLGAADALMLAGFALFVASTWVRSRIDANGTGKLLDQRGECDS